MKVYLPHISHNLPFNRSPGKYLARIGQALSSTVATVEIPSYRRIPDIKNDKYCFTDGNVKICSRVYLKCTEGHILILFL